jgi:type I restriction enzyme S subunit
MSGWPTKRLGDVCTQVTVGHVGKMSDQYIETGVPFLRSQDIRPGFIDTSNLKFISKEFHGRLRKSRLSPGDVAIVRTGYPGTAAVVPETLPDANCSDLVIARPGPALQARFLAYTLNSPWGRSQIGGRLVGAAQQHFNVRVAQALEIPFPPIETQHRIASILGAYDDLIEVNRRRVTVLEEMARGLFEEWFVRFRFPGHEAVSILDTPDGPMPEGWKQVTVSEAFELLRGRSYRSAELADEGGMPFVNLKCMDRDGGFRVSGLKRFTGDFKPNHAVVRGDIVLAVTDMTQERRIIGRAARIPLLDEPEAVISMDLVKVQPREGIDRSFLYCWLRYSDFGIRAAQHANGANVLHLSPKAIVDLPFVLPPSNSQVGFGRTVESLFAQTEVLAVAERRLSASRDLLLPRLISGQLSVAEAERQLEEAA